MNNEITPPQIARVTIVVSPRERFEQAEMSLSSCFDLTVTQFQMVYIDVGSPRYIAHRSEEYTSVLQLLHLISYAFFCF